MQRAVQKNKEHRFTLYSFILTVLVIFIHARNLESMTEGTASAVYGAACICEELLSDTLGQLAVPGFFILSGFLFFRNTDGRDLINTFAAKLKRRFFSLLVPYLCWNTFYFAVTGVLYKGECSAGDILQGIFMNGYAPHLWYLRQLMLISVIAPFTWIFLRKKTAGAIFVSAVFAAAVMYTRLPFHAVNEDALFYFSLGGFLSLHTDIYDEKKDRLLSAVTAAAAAVTYVLTGSFTGAAALVPVILYRASGALFAFYAVMILRADKNREYPFMNICFFVYCFHYLAVRALTKAVSYITKGAVLPLLVLYLAMPAVAFILSDLVLKCMRRFIPRVSEFVTGGR